MSEHPQTLAAPGTDAVVEIVEAHSGARLTATCESMAGDHIVLVIHPATRVPRQASLRWDEGGTVRCATATLERIDELRVSCRIVPPQSPAPTPRSQRAPIADSKLLVRIVSSGTVANGRRVHATCLDISETGCRSTWPGPTPRIGDAVDLTWDAGGARSRIELGWIRARVTRLVPLASGGWEVCFSFEITKATQAARIHSWYQGWLQHRP
jgi:hypothetical protein